MFSHVLTMLFLCGLAAASCITLLLKVHQSFKRLYVYCAGEPAWHYWQRSTSFAGSAWHTEKWLDLLLFALRGSV